MYLRLLACFMAFSVLLASCSSKTEETAEENLSPGTHKVVVDEVIHTTNYTYLRVDENGSEKWLAITKREVSTGDVFYYNNGLEMRDFKSDELNRTFDAVYFIDNLSSKPPAAPKANMTSPFARTKTQQDTDISIEPVKGSVSISDLYGEKDRYKGELLKVRGKVVKFNANIMGRNWVHIQDGSGDADHFDLTITTDARVKVGDVVTFEGRIGLDKDFGAGYSYDLIMEEAELITNI